jgi:hypothetical protein
VPSSRSDDLHAGLVGSFQERKSWLELHDLRPVGDRYGGGAAADPPLLAATV